VIGFRTWQKLTYIFMIWILFVPFMLNANLWKLDIFQIDLADFSQDQIDRIIPNMDDVNWIDNSSNNKWVSKDQDSDM